MTREEMIDAVMKALPDEMTIEDIACVMMSIVGNYSDGVDGAHEIMEIFVGAAMSEILAGNDGYFGGEVHARH